MKYRINSAKSVSLMHGPNTITLTYAELEELATQTGLLEQVVDLTIERTMASIMPRLRDSNAMLGRVLQKMSGGASVPKPQPGTEAFGGSGSGCRSDAPVLPWWKR